MAEIKMDGIYFVFSKMPKVWKHVTMIFIECYFHLTNYKNRDNVKKKLNVKLKIVNKLFLKKNSDEILKNILFNCLCRNGYARRKFIN